MTTPCSEAAWAVTQCDRTEGTDLDVEMVWDEVIHVFGDRLCNKEARRRDAKVSSFSVLCSFTLRTQWFTFCEQLGPLNSNQTCLNREIEGVCRQTFAAMICVCGVLSA